MKTAVTFIAIVFTLSSCCKKQDNVTPNSINDTNIQAKDSIDTGKSLNDIRFDGWEERDWLDNEYIRTLRKYLNDYNSGKVCNAHLDPYKELIKENLSFVTLNLIY